MPVVAALSHQFAWNTRLLLGLVAGFAGEEWWHEVAGQHACWLVGHLTIRRRQMTSMIGLSLPGSARTWERCFRRDTLAAAVPRSIVPGELVDAFTVLHRSIASHWSQITAADLTAPLDRPFSDGSKTMGAGLRYLIWNETYHLGQLGLVRCGLGKQWLPV